MNLRIAIVDDEPKARKNLVDLLIANCPNIVITAEASSVEEACQVLSSQPLDLVLLDIELQDGTGFDLLDQIAGLKLNVIFTTAYNEFAIRAFRYNALDYLLKPIHPDELIASIQKAREKNALVGLSRKIAMLQESKSDHFFDNITLPTSDGPVFTRTKEIVRLESYGNYTFLYMINGERHLASRNLKEFEEILPRSHFFRPHQSHMVNTTFVKKLMKEDGGYAVMHDGNKVPVARRRKEAFFEVLNGEPKKGL